MIVPGDFVNILWSAETVYCKPDLRVPSRSTGAEGARSSPSPNPGQIGQVPSVARGTFCNPARYLYQAAKVLFVDKTAVPQPGEITSSGTNAATPSGAAQTSVNTGLITLEVPATAAQLIASIAPEELYLTLLPQNYVPEPLPKLDPFPAVLPGEDATQLTPYGPQGFQSQK